MSVFDPKTLRKVLFIVLSGIVLAIVVNLVSNELGQILKDSLGDNYLVWLLGVGGIVVVVYLFLAITSGRSAGKEPSAWTDVRQELLTGTLKRYQKRQREKLNDELTFKINIELKYVETKTDDPVHKSFTFQPEKERIREFQKFFESFYKEKKRLLILGDPGSGKSLLLLRLAEMLIQEALVDPEHPIPIIINLGGWRTGEESLEEWMIEQLRFSGGEAGLSRDLAEELVTGHQVMPLFDGLDEIPEPHREGYLKALHAYQLRKENQAGLVDKEYPEFIICSRRIEYYNIDLAAPVYATAVIQPLTPVVVKATLDQLVARKNKAAAALLIDFRELSHLRQALNTAFFVHTALSLYARGWRIPQEDEFVGGAEAVQQELIESFLEEEFKRLEQATAYKSEKARYWLGWLADRLGKSNKGVSFELADMQPDWLGGRVVDKVVFSFGYCLLIAFFIEVSSWMFFPLEMMFPSIRDPTMDNSNYLLDAFISLLAGLTFSLFFSLISTTDFWLVFIPKKGIGKEIFPGILCGMVVIVVFVVLFFLFTGEITFRLSFWGKSLIYCFVVGSGIIFFLKKIKSSPRDQFYGVFVGLFTIGYLCMIFRFKFKFVVVALVAGPLLGFFIWFGRKSIRRIRKGFWRIKYEDKIIWSSSIQKLDGNKVYYSLLSKLGQGFIYGPIFTLLFVISLFFESDGFIQDEGYDQVDILVLMTFGFTGGPIVGFVFGLFDGLSRGFRTVKNFARINRPHQRITANLFLRIRQWALTALVFSPIMILIILDEDPDSSIGFIMYTVFQIALLGAICGYLFHGFSKFVALYMVLYLRGTIPFRLVRFLTQTADTSGLLEKDGGEWRFRHDLLQRALERGWQNKTRNIS